MNGPLFLLKERIFSQVTGELFKADFVPVEHGIGEKLKPVAQVDDAAAIVQPEIKGDMAVAKNKVINGFFHKVLPGKADELLPVRSKKGWIILT